MKRVWTKKESVVRIRITTEEVMNMLIAYVLVMIAVGMDLKCMRISNRLILVGLGIAFVQRLLGEGVSGVLTWAFQISIPVIVLYLLFLVGILGAGDIKLFSIIGGFVDFKILFWCVIYSFLFAAILSLGLFLYYAIKERRIGLHKMHFSVAILFGLAISHLMQL